jgi:hypothetical protein
MYRNHRHRHWLLILMIGALLFSPGLSRGWGGQAHRWINSQAFRHLPQEMAGFQRWTGVVVAYASEADRRKGTDGKEGPRHYIDIDKFPEFHQGNLSHDLESLQAKHGHRFDVYGNGVVPWTIAGVTETLAVAMAAGDWSQVILRAADLGHYVGDCHQPLHCTENYDGQLSGNDGVHLRYEIHMLDRNLDQLRPDSGRAVYIEDPLEAIFASIPGTWKYVDSILDADRQARKRDSSYGTEYHRIMWDRTGSFTISKMAQAARFVADLWYTAWVDAGRPEFPSPAEAEAIASLQPDPGEDDLVTVQGVVTIGSGVLDDQHTRVYIQDRSGRGILLWDYHLQEGISRGDLVRVEGMAKDYRGLSEIVGPSVTVLERDLPLPGPRSLATGEIKDPRWDNTLIQVQGTVVFTLQDEDWIRVHLDDGSGAAVALVQRATGIDITSLREGQKVTISGVGAYLDGEGSRVILSGYQDQVVVEKVLEIEN